MSDNNSWKGILRETVTGNEPPLQAETAKKVELAQEAGLFNIKTDNKPFNWDAYLKGLGIALLSAGILAALALLFIFKAQEIVTAVCVLFGSVVFHGLFCWFSEVLKRLDKK